MPRSVTSRGRLIPWAVRWSATSLRAPGPKWMVVGKLKRSRLMGFSKKKDHVFFIEILAGDLDGARLHAKRFEACALVQFARGDVGMRDSQHQLFQSVDVPRMVNDRLQQCAPQPLPGTFRSDVHRDDVALVPILD